MAFESRLQTGVEFEEQVVSYLESHNFTVTRYGSEYTDKDIANQIRSSSSPEALVLRYKPDGIALKNMDLFFWEAKNGMNIEKNAYEQYIKIEQQGSKVIVFSKSNNSVYCATIGKIKFLDSNEIVNRFPENRRLPVVDGWITPRLGHGTNGKGSGTPYKQIDYDFMRLIADWTQRINNEHM